MTEKKRKSTEEESAKQETGEKTEEPQEETKKDKKEKKKEKKEEKKQRKEDEKIEELKEENAQLKEQILRNQAELENFKKRMREERIKDRKFANAELVKGLLPILDNFDLALERERQNESLQASLKGFEMIKRDLFKTLKDAGLEEVEALGEPFDPTYHQAVSTEARTDCEENTVLEEMQKGYLFKDRLLRPAMVKVSVVPEEDSENEENTASEEKGEC